MERPLEFFVSVGGNLRSEVEEIVEEVFSSFERIGGVEIPRLYVGGSWKKGDFGSVEWYEKQAFNPYRNQVSGEKLWELCGKEPWQHYHPHYELMIISKDMYSEGANFIFGSTIPKISSAGIILSDFNSEGRPEVRGCIISLNRILKYYGSRWRTALRGIIIHELGHFYGLPASENPNYIWPGSNWMKSSLDLYHCNRRDCMMEQINTPGRLDLLEKVDFVMERNPNWFCEYDLRALQRNLRRLHW
jgi:predicted Zn-dependent protease